MKINIDWMTLKKAILTAVIVFWGAALVLAIFGFAKYSGQGYVYVLFTLVSNLLLYFGFRKNAIFFDTFIGIFTWLGFWLKFTIRILSSGGVFHEPVGNFDATADAFDLALLVATCGLGGFLLASYVREKFYQKHEMLYVL